MGFILFTAVCCALFPSTTAMWTKWTPWSKCSRTCGLGSRIRMRSCTTGSLRDCCSLETCDTDDIKQTTVCHLATCPRQGRLREWGQWSKCSAECGQGKQLRSRTCSPEGAICTGSLEDSRPCFVQCPVDKQALANMDKTTCKADTCKNGGKCTSLGDDVTCQCTSQWRGRNCGSRCLHEDESCEGKRGLFFVCGDCKKFIVCTVTERKLLQRCLSGKVWTGYSCEIQSEKSAKCVETA